MVIKHLIGTCIKKYLGNCIGLHTNQPLQSDKLNEYLNEWGKTAGQDVSVAIARIQDAYQTRKKLDLSDLNLAPIPEVIIKELKHHKIKIVKNSTKNVCPSAPLVPTKPSCTPHPIVKPDTSKFSSLPQDSKTYLDRFKTVSFNQSDIQNKLLTRKPARDSTNLDNLVQTTLPSYQKDTRLHQLIPSHAALHGSCMAFSARWLKSMQTNPDHTQAQTRIDTMQARHGAEAALLQKIYSGFRQNYKSREQDLYELIKTEQALSLEGAPAESDQTVSLEHNAQARIDTVRKAVESFISSGYHLEAEHQTQIKLFLRFIGLNGANKHTLTHHITSTDTFSCQLFQYIKVNQGALYSFCGTRADKSEWGHATGIFRRENSMHFFDPNYGEFEIPNIELDQFMHIFLQKFYYAHSTLSIQYLIPIIENTRTQPKGLDEIYQERLSLYKQLNTA
jgi:hypothetical protein